MSVARPSDRGTAPCALDVRLRLALAILMCAAVAGCTSTSIGLQKDGTYNLESGEHGMDCTRLSNSIWGRLQVLKALPAKAKAERETAAPTAEQAFSRWFGGSNKGLASLEEYDRERAHIRSLHSVLIGKGCPPLDIERELAATDAEISQYR